MSAAIENQNNQLTLTAEIQKKHKNIRKVTKDMKK
jgi:hypothetical protein